MFKKGQLGGRVMVVIFGTILLVAVAIPITNEIIAAETVIRNATGHITRNGSLSGIVATIVGFIPLFLGLAGLALAASLVSA